MPHQRMIAVVMAATAAFLGAGLPQSWAAETAPQTVSRGGVSVTVAPRGFDTDTWEFDVTLETHTQALNDDLTRSSTLLGDGKAYLPIGWEGPSPGGHHREGLLRFKAIVPPPQVVELQIRRAGETGPRVFRWQIN